MREFSVPASVRVDDVDTLSTTVFALADEQPDAVALRRRVDDTWVDVTCAAFTAQVVDVARGLVASGIAPGDRIALLSRTRYEWTLFDYAIVAAGAVTVPIYETSSAEQVAWILADSGAKADRGGGRPARRDRDRHRETPPRTSGGSWPTPTGRARWRRSPTRGASVPAARRCTSAGPPPGRRPRHADLHLRHHRPPEGLRAHPRATSSPRCAR